jgi:hypothetical protein
MIPMERCEYPEESTTGAMPSSAEAGHFAGDGVEAGDCASQRRVDEEEAHEPTTP